MSLQPGNSKLGPGVWQWSIPAGTTCPGQTPLCALHCYAKRSHFIAPVVRQALIRNKHLAESPEFGDWMLGELRRANCRVVRIHVAGDFHRVGYLRQWWKVIRRRRNVVFYAYTRSWREPRLLPLLRAMAREPNFLLWFSCDRDTAAPPRIAGVRRAYMAVDRDDVPRYRVDLVFRAQRRGVQKYDVAGNLICPKENGVTKTTCEKCRLCFTRREIPRHATRLTLLRGNPR